MLPAWKAILQELQMAVSFLPRDVMTRWNSTFDMIDYALLHWKAINNVAQDRELGLRRFELSNNEWIVLGQLHNVLKVRLMCSILAASVCPNQTQPNLDSQECHNLLFSVNTQPCQSDTRHGSHPWWFHKVCSWQEICCAHLRRHLSRLEDIELILLAHRWLWGLSHCHGYISFCNSHSKVLTSLLQ